MSDAMKLLQDEALDRLRNATSVFELDKAKAIADFVQWLVEREYNY